jgi:hypothetical protein
MAAVPCLGISQELGKAAGGCRHEATSGLADGWPLSGQGDIKRTKVAVEFFTVLGPPLLALFGSDGGQTPPKRAFQFALLVKHLLVFLSLFHRCERGEPVIEREIFHKPLEGVQTAATRPPSSS